MLRIAGSACALLLSSAGAGAAAATPDECHALRKHGHRAEAQSCFQSLDASRAIPTCAPKVFWGLEHYEDANNEFRAAVAQSDKNAHVSGSLGPLDAREIQQSEDADNLFKEALDATIQRTPMPTSVWRSSARTDSTEKAVAWASKAIELDPKLVEAHELLANLYLEDSDTKKAIAEADKALEISPDALDAMAIHAAIEASRRPLAGCVV